MSRFSDETSAWNGPTDFESVVSQFADRVQAGEVVSLDEMYARYPQWSDELRELLPTLLTMESARGESATGPRHLPDCLGDFELIREIGRGGMGIVYEALQRSLHRQVALKVLPAGHLLDEQRVKRFEREATIAASLHHPNIVPVFGVGEDQGFRFIVMQLIQGETLADRIERERAELAGSGSVVRESDSSTRSRRGRIPRDYQAIAGLMLQSARGLEFAHQQGMLHRDVKPSNLLLGDGDQVWLADFGLARALDFSDVSRTGEVVGTWRYMAPEQRLGQASITTDVFGLGATFYEYVTGEPLVSQDQLNAWIAGHRHPPTPRKPRSICGDVPRDLETILMKCVEETPGRRYQSATELVEDLKRFIDQRPIRARPTNWIEGAAKWSRRNPLAATLAGVSVSLVVLLLVTALLGYQFEARQRYRAEETRRIALEAVDRVFDRLAPLTLAPGTSNFADPDSEEWVSYASQPFVSADTAELLRELLPVLDQISVMEGERADLQLAAARASRRIGDIELRLGNFQRSLSSYQSASTRLEQARSQLGDAPSLVRESVSIDVQLGLVALMQQESAVAQERFGKVIERIESLGAGASRTGALTAGDRGLLFEQARAHYLLGLAQRQRGLPFPGWLFRDGGRFARGRGGPGPRDGRGPGRVGPSLERPGLERSDSDAASSERERVVRRPPDGLASGQPGPLGAGFGMGGMNPQGASVEFAKAIEILEGWEGESSQDPEVQFLLALCYRDQLQEPGPGGPGPGGPGPRRWGEPFELASGTERANEILTDLVGRFPDFPEYRLELAETLSRVPPPERLSSERRESLLSDLDRGVELVDGLLLKSPDSPRCLETAIRLLDRRASHLGAMNQAESAMLDLRRAKGLGERLVSLEPGNMGHTALLVGVLQQSAQVALQLGDSQQARDDRQRGLELLATWSEVPELSRYVGVLRSRLSESFPGPDNQGQWPRGRGGPPRMRDPRSRGPGGGPGRPAAGLDRQSRQGGGEQADRSGDDGSSTEQREASESREGAGVQDDRGAQDSGGRVGSGGGEGSGEKTRKVDEGELPGGNDRG